MKVFNSSKEKKEIVSATDHFYPSTMVVLREDCSYEVPEFSTAFGVADGSVAHSSGQLNINGSYAFCITSGKITCTKGTSVIFVRHGFRGQECFGVKIENIGRLSYIDGCSDSLLIYPPRQGDPCLNALYFPQDTTQTFHSHPSIRLGYVLSGSGWANTKTGEIKLSAGDSFLLEPLEIHRFKTLQSPMVVIAYHPDSDWGPTDHQHPMLSRTYIANANKD